MSGDCMLEAPVFKGKKDARRTDISSLLSPYMYNKLNRKDGLFVLFALP